MMILKEWWLTPFVICCICPPHLSANFAKTKRGASGGFLPRPLLLRLRRNEKWEKWGRSPFFVMGKVKNFKSAMPGYDLKKVKFTTDGAIFERVVGFRWFFWVGS